MSIAEVQLISSAGIPLFYHSNTGETSADVNLLQAGFITALTTFAEEMKQGEVRLISFDLKNYIVSKTEEFMLIFTSTKQEMDAILAYQSEMKEVSEFFNESLEKNQVSASNPNTSVLDPVITEFDQYLRDKKLITGGDNYDGSSFRSKVNSLIFKSVGYEPGVCNIGRAERLDRLSWGLLAFVISFALFVTTILLGLPPWLRLFLIIPNFAGFIGLYQYQYRFCVTNALARGIYNMN